MELGSHSTVEDEEANVSLLGFTLIVFQFSSFGEQFLEEWTEIVQYLIGLLTSFSQEISCVSIQQGKAVLSKVGAIDS